MATCNGRARSRPIERIGDRETRWVEDYLHRISKAIVQEAVTHGCDRIVFEELTDIRDRMPGAKKFHTWAFRRLYDHVAYKAESEDIEATQVDPAYTSKRCSKCGKRRTRTVRLKRSSVARSAATKSTQTTTRRRTSDFGYSVRGKSLRTEGRSVTSP